MGQIKQFIHMHLEGVIFTCSWILKDGTGEKNQKEHTPKQTKILPRFITSGPVFSHTWLQ